MPKCLHCQKKWQSQKQRNETHCRQNRRNVGDTLPNFFVEVFIQCNNKNKCKDNETEKGDNK